MYICVDPCIAITGSTTDSDTVTVTGYNYLQGSLFHQILIGFFLSLLFH